MDIKFKLMALLITVVAIMFFGLTSANATVETGWPDGTPNNCRNSTDGFMDFELGVEAAEIESTIPDLEFTTTYGLNWRYGDIRTGNYNVNPYLGAMYETNGNFFAWLGVTGDAGRITFTGGTASYLSVLVSTYSGVTLDAYDADGNFLATSGWATSNINTGTLTRLTVEADGIAYVDIHDTGNYWLIDDLCTDATPPCQPVPGRTIGNNDERIDLVFVPDEDYGGDIDAFLNDVASRIDDRLGGVAPIDDNLDMFNFYYTELEGDVTSTEIGDAANNCGQENSLPDNLLNLCPYADAVVVLHTRRFSDCKRSSGAVGIFSAEGAINRSFIHEGGHGIFELRDEYDADLCTTAYTSYWWPFYCFDRPRDSNIWATEANCRDDAQDQDWDPDQCYEFTDCQCGWWKLGDPSLADDDERYNDENFRFIMFDGNYFSNGFGVAAERRILWVFDQLPVTPEPPLPSPSSEKSIILELNISDGGLVLLDSGFITDPPPEYLPGEYSLTAKMFSTSGNLLGEYGFADPRKVQAEMDYTGPFTLESANFTLLLPYFKNVGEANIIDTETGGSLLSVDLSAFATGGSGPIADAGPDQTVAVDANCLASVTLDGSGSSDPDGDPLSYQWTWNSSSATGVNPIIQLPLGTFTITLLVNDGTVDSEPDTVTITVIDDTPPDITCSDNQIVECVGPDGASVSFDTTVSDNCPGEILISCEPPSDSVFPIGETIDTCIATDDSDNQNTCSFTVAVVDTTPPSIESVTASPNVLWPPNHKLVPVSIDVSVLDTCDTEPICKIVSVSSNEPEDSMGDGHTSPDWIITGDLTVDLRAERSGMMGDGRIYTITVECSDNSTNSATGTLDVSVAHDIR